MPGRRLAELIETTTPFISQVVNPLVQNGWIDSKPGPAGGYGLVADLTTLTILEVVEVVEGPIDNGRCVLAGGPCGELCSVHEAWVDGRRALRDAFARVTLVHN